MTTILFNKLLKYLEIINRKEFDGLPSEEKQNYIRHRFYVGYGNYFYLRLYVKYADWKDLLSELSKSDLEALLLKCKVPKKARERDMKLYNKYQTLGEETKKMFQDIISHNPYRLKK